MVVFAAAATAAPDNDFEISLRQVDPAAMTGGSVVLDLRLKFRGSQPFTTDSLEPPICFQPWRPYLRFDLPDGWKTHPMREKTQGTGFVSVLLPLLEFRKGEDYKVRIYLQDYFEVTTPGRHSLRFSLPLWDVTNRRTVELVGTTMVSLQPFDKKKFSAYVDALLAFVTKPADPDDNPPVTEEDRDKPEPPGIEEERMERCKELLSLRHDEVLRTYATILETDSLMFIHHVVRADFAERTLASATAREAAVKFVRRASTRNREFFLDFWKRNNVQLSQEEMETILGSTSGP